MAEALRCNADECQEIFVHSVRMYYGEAPELLCQLLPEHLQLDPCLRRSVRSHDLAVQIPRSNLVSHKRSFVPSAARIWNSLPVNRYPWITKGLLKSINNKNKLYKQYIHSPSKKGLQKFKTYKNKLNMLIRKAKRKYFFKRFESSKNNMKQTWNTINSVLGRGKKTIYTEQI